MNNSTTAECDAHPGRKLNKFCKNSNCWTQVCPKCAAELHKGHKVVEYGTLISEAMSVKENLLQIKKGDLLSIKRIINNATTLQTQLKEAQQKRKEEKLLAESHVLSKIGAIASEGEAKYKELNEMLGRLHDKLKNIHNTQAQELSKIPELANAVIAEGTIEDLKTFFEMCQQGSESNVEILQHKKRADKLRKCIEEYAMQTPFQFVFKLNKSLFEALKKSDSSLEISGLMDLSKDEKNAGETTEKQNKVRAPPLAHNELSSLRKDPKKRLSSIAQYNIVVSPSQESLLTCKSARASNKMKASDPIRPLKRLDTGRSSLVGEFNRTRTMSNVSNYGKLGGTVRLSKKTASIVGPVRNSSVSKDSSRTPRLSLWSSKLKSEALKSLRLTVVDLKKQLKALARCLSEKVNSILGIVRSKGVVEGNRRFDRRVAGVKDEVRVRKLQLIDFAERVMDSVFKCRFAERKALSKITAKK